MEMRRIPKFETASEEAAWWYEHRDEIADDMIAASREGRLGPGLKVRLLERQRTIEEKSAHHHAPESSSKAA
jgi:hypothetical protein